jgi:gliding motility-associated-like protein
LVDPTTGNKVDGAYNNNPTENNSTQGIGIKWLKPGTNEIGILETSLNGTGCTNDTTFYTVEVHALDLGLTAHDKAFCFGDTLSLATSGKDVTPWNWTYNGSTVSNQPTIKAEKVGKYWVSYKDAKGCIGFDSLVVKAVPKVAFDFTNRDQLSNDTLKFHVKDASGDLYARSTNDDNNNESSYASGNSVYNMSYNWNVLDNKTLSPDNFTNANDPTYIPGLSYSNFGTTDNQYRAAFNAHAYYPEEDKTCTGSDTLVLVRIASDLSSTIANYVTPNEVKNNTWDLSPILNIYPKLIVIIYDRWGRMVFQSEPGYAKVFDGHTNSGSELPMDSYHYIIKPNDDKGSDPIIGNITVIR